MKKIVAILLLVVFLFNAMGFYAIIFVLQYKTDYELEKKLDADEYSGSGTMIVKIPSPFPYCVNFNAYERAQGEFECDGEFYKLVKQKQVNDTLFVLLIKNERHRKLQKSLKDYARENRNEPLSKSNSKLVEHFEKNFISTIIPVQINCAGWCRISSFGNTEQFHSRYFPSLISPPPESLFFV